MELKAWAKSLGGLLLLAACTTPAPQPTTPDTPSPAKPAEELRPVNANLPLESRPEAPRAQIVSGFMRGINLGNFLDAPKDANWRPAPIGEEHIKHVAKLGFDHVRFPVRFADYTDQNAPYAIQEEFLKKVDGIIDLALKNKLNVVLDLHHFEAIMNDPKGQEARAIAIWEQLGKRYQKLPNDRVAFEALNEPFNKLEGDTWNQLAAKLIKTIRATNPKRLIIINSGFWAAASRLPLLKLPDDPNVIASFHMYEPFLFTHQGASWVTPPEMTANKGIVFPGPGPKKLTVPTVSKDLQWVSDFVRDYNEKPFAENPSGYARIAQEFAHVDALIKQGRRLYMGEFGAIEFADAKSRENYVRLIREEAERRNIAWAYWDDGGAFKLIDLKNGDVAYIRDALFPKATAAK